MKRGGWIKAIGLIMAMVTTQGGCIDPRGQSNARLRDYSLIGEEKAIDPETGDTVVTSHWEYEDGVTTTTKRRIPRGHEDRRWDRPPPRVVD
ncbi:hypothetical protein [Dongia sp.]|uniref:hypothetical protein n=1 Tax=Dongia sp. TaxID=1977262 RepID=UPI0037529677